MDKCSSPIRVLLADDHSLVRTGLRVLLSAQPDITVVGEAGDAEETVRQALALQPDVVVLDIAMPGGGGLEAARRISESRRPIRILVLTAHGEAQYLLPVLRAGGSGYLLKSGAAEDLVQAIRAVHRGEAYLPPPAATLLVRDYLRRVEGHAADTELSALSPREREVLRLTAEGYDSREIGERLFLSSKTVETYRQRGMEKLGLHHRADLVRYALRNGLLSDQTQ